jgi:DNA-binding beta-propeller fold protein YncE
MKKTLLLSLALSFLFVSCKKDNADPQPVVSLENGVYILNQGNFTAGNASLSYFQNNGEKLYNDLFFDVNAVPLGDVAQSITIDNSKAYIVVNNSGFIYVVDSKTVEYQAKISGLTSPRYMTIVSQNKAYVSDLYSTGISIVDISTNEVIGAIEVGRSTEEMKLIGSEVFVANWSGYGQTMRNDKILVVNTFHDQLVDSISVGLEPNSMVVDKEGYLWVLCSGGYLNEEIPTLWKIDAPNRHIIETLTFNDINTNPDNLEINGAGDSLFFLNHGVYKMALSDAHLPNHASIEENGSKLFLNLGIDPHNGNIYVSDALDYSQNGYVYRYGPAGNFIEQLEVGIIPGPFGFNY